MNSTPTDYRRIAKIGEGTYSTVYSGTNTKTGQAVALKDINLTSEDGAPSTALREIAFLKQMSRHPHILTLIDVLHPREDSLTLVFEHLSLDLRQFLDKHHPTGMPLQLVKSFMRQILDGLHVCHQNYIIHRDLKPQNILIDLNTGTVKLGDFGLARGFAIPVSGYSPEVVTLWYRPPEILLGNTIYSSPVDMWSAGCILIEMLTGKAPFQGRNAEDQLKSIMGLLGSPNQPEWQELNPPPVRRANPTIEYYQRMYTHRAPYELVFARIDPQAVDLLKNLLIYSPRSRYSAAQALQHPFLRYP